MKASSFALCTGALALALLVQVPGLDAAQQDGTVNATKDSNVVQQPRTSRTGLNLMKGLTLGLMGIVAMLMVPTTRADTTIGYTTCVKQVAWNDYVTALDIVNDLTMAKHTHNWDNPAWKEYIKENPKKVDGTDWDIISAYERDADDARRRYLALATDEEKEYDGYMYFLIKKKLYECSDDIPGGPCWYVLRVLRNSHRHTNFPTCENAGSEFESFLASRHELDVKEQELQNNWSESKRQKYDAILKAQEELDSKIRDIRARG